LLALPFEDVLFELVMSKSNFEFTTMNSNYEFISKIFYSLPDLRGVVFVACDSEFDLGDAGGRFRRKEVFGGPSSGRSSIFRRLSGTENVFLVIFSSKN